MECKLVVRCEFHLNITMLLNLEYQHSIITLILFELIGMLVHLEVKMVPPFSEL